MVELQEEKGVEPVHNNFDQHKHYSGKTDDAVGAGNSKGKINQFLSAAEVIVFTSFKKKITAGNETTFQDFM